MASESPLLADRLPGEPGGRSPSPSSADRGQRAARADLIRETAGALLAPAARSDKVVDDGAGIVQCVDRPLVLRSSQNSSVSAAWRRRSCSPG